jgi:hypothetical protein
LTAQFGLGATTVADSVIVNWPSGIEHSALAIAADQILTITEPDVMSADSTSMLPVRFALSAGQPKPFNESSVIQYELPRRAPVSLRIFDVRGRIVRVLESTTKEPGRYRTTWNARDNAGLKVGSGVYLCVMEAGEFRATRRLVLLR